MKLVVDANVLFSFFKKESFTRNVMLAHPELTLFTPEYVFDELERHKEELKSRAKIDDTIFRLTKSELMEYVTVVPLERVKKCWEEAVQISPDPDDVVYFALALALNCAIWSNDRDVKEKQSRVLVVATHEVSTLLGLE